MSRTHGVKSRLPLPLNSIRVFAEAAREGNFSRAAKRLDMTQGAVSQHVASLERFLGKQLFVRSGAVVTLSDAGRLYFDNVQESLATLELATHQMRSRHGDPGRLLVRTSLPTFAMTWLIPSLPAFVAGHGTEVDLVSSLSPPGPGDFFDVLVTRDLSIDGAEQWALAEEELVCVASPVVRERVVATTPSEWPFIAAASRPDALQTWLRQQDAGAAPRITASFDHYFLAVSAVAAGLGCLVVPRLLVREQLRLGHLAEMPGQGVRGGGRYCAYVSPETAVPEAARAFCRHLKRLLSLA